MAKRQTDYLLLVIPSRPPDRLETVAPLKLHCS